MESVDPETLLEWLQTGFGDGRDIQVCFYLIVKYCCF